MKKFGTLFILVILLVGCSNLGGKSSGEFTVGNISTSEFEDNEKYFLVIPLEWDGEDSAKIEAVELIKEDEELVNVDNDRINYVFYGADVNTKTGVYQRGELGATEEIDGFEVEGESRLVLEITLMDVLSDSNRRIKIKYMVGGEEKEQVIESSMIESLRTKE